MSFTSSTDTAAEREGMAIEAMAEWMDRDVPQTKLQVAMGHARAAAARGIPTPSPLPHYRRFSSCRVHAYLTERAPWRVLVWGRPQSKRLPADGAAERKRQAEKRLMRARNLLSLQYVPAGHLLSLVDASLYSGIGQRTLERALSNGRLAGVVAPGRRRMIRAGSLRNLLADKLQGRPIAA